jgi:hypothetical protein
MAGPKWEVVLQGEVFPSLYIKWAFVPISRYVAVGYFVVPGVEYILLYRQSVTEQRFKITLTLQISRRNREMTSR